MALTMLAILNPGDEVIVFSPYFAMYRSQIELAGGVCVDVPTYACENYAISEERLRAAITPKTKAMAIEKLGYPVVSLCGWQVGMNTSSTHSFARIKKVTCERVKEELDKKRIVLVAGFQGVDKYGDVTTLGRGGSDTTAVAMAIALQADLCQIFTDVDGIYTCDPRIVPEAKKLPEITYNEMLELASLGAQVLNNRSVELAKSYGVQLEVLSSFSGNPVRLSRRLSRTWKRLISPVWRRIKRSRALPLPQCRTCRALPTRYSACLPRKRSTST